MILCSRLRCGCMASALLSGAGEHGEILLIDEREFTQEEILNGRIVQWEDREEVYAERCPVHEAEYIANHPDYIP